MPTPDDDSGSDREDELPQVVVLKSGDLTEEEVKTIKDKMHKGSDAKKGKTLFYKDRVAVVSLYLHLKPLLESIHVFPQK